MAALTPIGCSPLIDGTVQFLKNDKGGIFGRWPDHRTLVRACLPEFTSSWSCSSDVKIARLMRNFHMETVFEKGQIHFKPISNDKKEWEIQEHTLLLSQGGSSHMVRANGTISYATFNTVTTWDYIQNRCNRTLYKTGKITALAEDQAGELIVGDSKGNLAIGDRVVKTPIGKEIGEIIPLFDNFYILKTRPWEASFIVFDLVTEQKVDIDVEGKEFLCGWDTKLACSKQEAIIVYTFDSINKTWQNREFGIPLQASLTHVANTKAKVLISDPNNVVLKDLETEVSIEFGISQFPDQSYDPKVLFLEGNLICSVSEYKREKTIGFFSLQEFKVVRTAPQKSDVDITAFAILSDESIVYATNSMDSEYSEHFDIHFINKKGECLCTVSIAGDRSVISLIELVDGSVAAQFNDHIAILKPKLKDLPDTRHEIEKLKLELRNFPDSWRRYEALIDLYKPESDAGKRSQVCLSALQSALKSNDLYRARRYYSKANKRLSDVDEPFKVFSSYLENSPHKKLKREVFLKKDPSRLVGLKEKTCKNRLIIGEADFSYTEALLNKHEGTHSKLASAITATELLLPKEDSVIKRIEALRSRGVTVHFCVDAQKIHEVFQGQRFKRIQWNCPFGGTDEEEREKFKDVMPTFFMSASFLQLLGDRIHVTLIQKAGDYSKVRQRENPIVLGATQAGYRLIRKRVFGTERYPGYRHLKTGTLTPYEGKGKHREFIFEKAHPWPIEATLENASVFLKDPRKKEYKIETDIPASQDGSLPGLEEYYFVASSDEDSSDYYESD